MCSGISEGNICSIIAVLLLKDCFLFVYFKFDIGLGGLNALLKLSMNLNLFHTVLLGVSEFIENTKSYHAFLFLVSLILLFHQLFKNVESFLGFFLKILFCAASILLLLYPLLYFPQPHLCPYEKYLDLLLYWAREMVKVEKAVSGPRTCTGPPSRSVWRPRIERAKCL